MNQKTEQVKTPKQIAAEMVKPAFLWARGCSDEFSLESSIVRIEGRYDASQGKAVIGLIVGSEENTSVCVTFYDSVGEGVVFSARQAALNWAQEQAEKIVTAVYAIYEIKE